MENLKQQLDKDGYIILKNFFDKNKIKITTELAKQIFKLQFNQFGYKGEFKNGLYHGLGIKYGEESNELYNGIFINGFPYQ